MMYYSPVNRESGVSQSLNKIAIDSLALFGGSPLFNNPKPTSNLVRPDPERFFRYLEEERMLIGETLVEELERRLAIIHHVDHCVVVNSGFWALALLIDAVALSERKEIILPSLTYRRMADILAWVGRVPHFCDIERKTLANSGQTVKSCVNENTALIIGVHPVGGHCDIDGLTQLAQEKGIPLIFDSVESVHEVHRGKRIGSFGDAELFSLGASKLVNGFEGGYITTNNAALANALRIKREGSGPGLSLSVPLPEVHAAMALSGLDDLPLQLERNLARFERYRKELSDLPELRLIEQDSATEPSHKNIVIEVLDAWPYSRDQTIQLLNAENILARAYYAPPLHHKPMRYLHIVNSLPNTDWVANRFISLPCGHLVSLEDITLIVALLRYIRDQAEAVLAGIATANNSSSHLTISDKPSVPPGPLDQQNRLEPETLRGFFHGIFQRQYYTESGPLVRCLEAEVGKLLGTNYVVCVSNPSVAWLMLLEAAELGSGRLLIPAIASRALQEAINWIGYLNRQYDVSSIAGCRSQRTDFAAYMDGHVAAMIASNPGDGACDPLRLKTLAEEFGVPLFYDASEYFSCRPDERLIDAWCEAVVFSFGTDNSVSSAGGACICTLDEALADRLRCMRSSGGVVRQVAVRKTVNGRMSEAQAAYALLSLKRLHQSRPKTTPR